MLISVIMSVYNEEKEWLIEAIDSILGQTHSNIEFIIVLDNPQNEVLKSVLLDYQDKDKRFNLIVNEKNIGLVKSLNKALKVCAGEYIARMDADDISHPERLEKQLKYITTENLDLIGSNVRLFKGNKEYFYTTDKLLTHKYNKKLMSAGTIGIVHPTFFANRDVYVSLGGYKMASHAEDQEFIARAIFNGFKVGNISDVLLDCRYNDKSITKSQAVYVYKVAAYTVKVFNESLKSGNYFFDEKFVSNMVVTEKEIFNFNNKQMFLAQARSELNNKKYISFLVKIIKAISSSSTVFNSIKINTLLKMFKKLENSELNNKM